MWQINVDDNGAADGGPMRSLLIPVPYEYNYTCIWHTHVTFLTIASVHRAWKDKMVCYNPYSLRVLVISILTLNPQGFSMPSAVPPNPMPGTKSVWQPASSGPGGFDTTQHLQSITSLQSGSAAGLGSDPHASSFLDKICRFTDKNFFLVGLFFAVLSAKFFPFVGVDGGILRPELFIGKYGVGLIFLLSGLSLQTSELANALSNMKLNGLIQFAIFVLWPLVIGLPLKALLTNFIPGLMPPALVDGLLIMTCLPTTVNMCIMLTSASGGNVAASICNAVLSNMAGIFITPALLFQFFGTQIRLPFVQMVLKLCKKVLLPVTVGQGLRATKVKEFYSSHSKFFKRLQEVILLGIAWNAFCSAFSSGLGIDLRQTLILLTLLPTLHLVSLAGLFQIFSLPMFGFSRGEVVAALFCSSQKTLAFGLPLIQTIFEGNANLAAYCAPLMFIHPLQMTLGSLLIPTISKYSSSEPTNGVKTN